MHIPVFGALYITNLAIGVYFFHAGIIKMLDENLSLCMNKAQTK